MMEENIKQYPIIHSGSTSIARVENTIAITNKIIKEYNFRFEQYFNEGIDLLFRPSNRHNYAHLPIGYFEENLLSPIYSSDPSLIINSCYAKQK